MLMAENGKTFILRIVFEEDLRDFHHDQAVHLRG
jgi:hypothetical protein